MHNIIFYQEKNLEIVEECLKKANRVVSEANCENTRKAMYADLRYWQAWCEANGFDFSRGLIKEHLIAFIIQHAEEMPEHIDQELMARGVKSKPGLHKMATIDRKIASLSTFLNLNHMPNHCYDADILFLMKKLKNRHGGSEPWGRAMTVDVLNDLLATCYDSIFDIRDKAILLFGFSTGGRRRSEIADATIEYLRKCHDGNYLYNLKHSKTNREGKDEIKPLFGRAAMALTHWLNVSNVKSGYLFRNIYKNGRIGDKISDKTIADIVKYRCKLAGYDPSEYSAHSLRSGFVTECGKRGKPIGDTMALTGHKDIKQLMQYYQVGNVANNSTAYLAG